MVPKDSRTISGMPTKPRVIPRSETSIRPASAAPMTESASSLWSTARLMVVVQIPINWRASDLSLTMRTYSSMLTRRGKPSVSEAR